MGVNFSLTNLNEGGVEGLPYIIYGTGPSHGYGITYAD
jgi:hypothetical protein